MRRKWKHYAAGVLMSAALVIGMVAAAYIPSAAADRINLDSACTLTVDTSGLEFKEDLAGANVVIDLYKVADAVKVDGYDTYTYSLYNDYAALHDDLLEGDETRKDLSNDSWRELEQKAARIALNDGTLPTQITPVVSGSPIGETIDSQDVTGGPLECGLYLLVARGSDLEDYTAIVKDDEDNEKLVTRAQSERHVYTFSPQLISLPDKADEDGDGIVNTADPTPWIYNRTVYLKLEQGLRYGRLEIVKTLTDYEAKSPATFVFDVEATLDGEPIYSNMVSITFTEPGQKTTLIDRIPVGAEVTVTEVYSGASYELVTDGTVNTTIQAEDVVQAAFTNTYTRRHRDGYGITNNFTYDEDEWHWNQWIEETE